MAEWGAKTIVLEKVVSEKADLASKNHHRFDETFNALQWLLARNQSLGLTKTENSIEWHVYVMEGDPMAGTPSIWVLYTTSPNEVNIFDINVVENGAPSI